MSETRTVTPRLASAVVLAREATSGGIEVFMVRRHLRSEFVPDAFVFPGGTVKPNDADVERTPSLCAPAGDGPTALGTGFRIAALRECFEEAGVLLSRRGSAPLAISPADVARFSAYREALTRDTLTLAELAAREQLAFSTDELLHWAHWITPTTFPKRFDTHFFLARMPAAQEATYDHMETTDGVWVTPEEALARFERGEFPLVFATIHQLQALQELSSIAAAWERFGAAPPRTIMPRVVQRDGQEIILLPEAN